jgi:gamma-glutamyltranspeptidase/glutathione hydrolase
MNFQKGVELDFLTTKRPPALGTKGAVASPHYLASQLGQEVIKKGGHAVDSAIAMNAVLAVVYPHMAGLGGDLMALVWDKENNEVEEFNGSGRTGQAVTRETYGDYDTIPERGSLAANTVPGVVDAWWKLHQKYGKLEWKNLFETAIDYAKNGFPISEKLSGYIRDYRADLEKHEEISKIFLKDDRIPEEGEIFIQEDLGHSLELIAEKGPEVFYDGELTEKIVKGLQNEGGFLTKEDFKKHQGEWSTPLTTNYRGYDVYEMRPNTQGISALIILNILENYDIQGIGDNTADYYHLMTEATKSAFLYSNEWLTDEEYMTKRPEEFTSKELAKELANNIEPQTITENLMDKENLPIFNTNTDTTYMSVVDEEGNTVSLIQSVYHEFGSMFIPEGTGLILQNRGTAFSLDPDVANTLEPGKKTFHTIIPTMMLKDGKPVMSYGTMGGEGQPQTQAAIVTRVIDLGYNIQQAIEAPRWLYGRTWGASSRTLKLESRIPDGIIRELKNRGHSIERLEDYSQTMGHAQGITINPDTGVLSAGADPRGDGIGLSW